MTDLLCRKIPAVDLVEGDSANSDQEHGGGMMGPLERCCVRDAMRDGPGKSSVVV